jgi:hypothetical protein
MGSVRQSDTQIAGGRRATKKAPDMREPFLVVCTEVWIISLFRRNSEMISLSDI